MKNLFAGLSSEDSNIANLRKEFKRASTTVDEKYFGDYKHLDCVRYIAKKGANDVFNYLIHITSYHGVYKISEGEDREYPWSEVWLPLARPRVKSWWEQHRSKFQRPLF